MRSGENSGKPLFWFYLVVTYVVLQFGWWIYLLFRLNGEVYELKASAILIGIPPETAIEQEMELNSRLNNRLLMIAGEGTVFLAFLLIGLNRVRKYFLKEMELGQQQKNFLLSVSHELKSPIASTKLQLETLRKRELDKETRDKIIDNAIRDNDRLHALVEKILLANRLENLNSMLVTERLNLSDFCSEWLKNYGERTMHRREIRSSITPDIYLDANADALESMLLNLVENAEKYSPAGTAISVSLASGEDGIELTISDNGPGITEAEKEKIFTKFYRSGNEERRQSKGTGLGLYIVKSLAAAHNAVVSVRPNQPSGSIFTIRFPW